MELLEHFRIEIGKDGNDIYENFKDGSTGK